MAYNFSSLVFGVLLFAASSYAIPVEQVKTICSQTKNPAFCLTLLNSKPGLGFIPLTQYTIDVAHAKITNTIKLINQLISQSATKPDAKNHYTSCLVHFGENEGALGDIEYTAELLKKGDYQGVGSSAAAVQTDVDDCISGESPDDPPYHDTSMLPKYASDVDAVAQIIGILSKYLVH